MMLKLVDSLHASKLSPQKQDRPGDPIGPSPTCHSGVIVSFDITLLYFYTITHNRQPLHSYLEYNTTDSE